MRPEISGNIARLCAKSLQLTLSEVVAIAVTGPKRYRVYEIDKRNGEKRQICQPSRELKAVQYVLIRNILKKLPVHNAATAYVPGGSIRDNATRHASGRALYKLDFRDFFPSIHAGDWVAYARKNLLLMSREDIRFTEYALFWGANSPRPECLSIGAPSSPYLSNALMFAFDETVTTACEEIGVTYTRYADDLTFSSKGHLDKAAVRAVIRKGIGAGYVPRLTLNEDKTVLISNGTQRRVTGLIIANTGQVSLGRIKKRGISAMVDHFRRGDLDGEQLAKLRGWLAFANDVEPDFVARLKSKYTPDLVDRIIRNE